MTQWREEDGTNRTCSSDDLMGILRALDPVDSTSERHKTSSSKNVSTSAGQNISSSTNGPSASATSDVVNSGEASASTTSIGESNEAYPSCTSSSSCEPSSSSGSSPSVTSASTVSRDSYVYKTKTATTTPDNGVSESGCNEDGLNTNFVASSNLTRGSERDKYAAPIPLPAPPSCSIGVGTVGSACGGNQSYIGYGLRNQTFQRLQDRPSSPTFGGLGTGTFGHTFSSSSSTAYIPQRPPGVVGLDNLGNTCFMNSGLQCLLNTPRIVEYFLRCGTINASNICPREKALVTEFQSLVRYAWWGSVNRVTPRDFKNVLGNIFIQFKDGRQHDCQEFLISTLDVLHEQLKLWTRQDNECGSSAITTSGRSDTSSGVYSGCASDTDISSSQTSPGETHCEASGSPVTKRRKINDESEESHFESKSRTSEDFKSAPSEEDSGTESVGVSIAPNLEIDDEEVILGLDIDHENDEIADVINVDGVIDEDSNANLVRNADEFWVNYLRENNTVIASSFQGMYKSTVKCSTCQYVSLTYEPFMYLSLPIPRISERQFDVTFSSVVDSRPKKVSVTLGVGETVGKLKEEVVGKVVNDSVWGIPLSTYVVAEVVNHAIFRLLSDETPLKNVYDGSRNIYVFELNQDFDDLSSTMYDTNIDDTNKSAFPFVPYQSELLRPMTYLEEDWETPDSENQIVQGPLPNPASYLEQQSSESYVNQTSDEGVQYQDTDPDIGAQNMREVSADVSTQNDANLDLSCSVCLEDFPKPNLRQHYGCSCILCVDCMTKTATHYDPPSGKGGGGDGDSGTKEREKNRLLKCPVCSETLDYEKTFLPLTDGSSADGDGVPKKLHQIPLLFRHDSESDSNNNSPHVSKLFSFPWVIRLPSAIPAAELYSFVNKINPFPDHNFKLLNLSWDGKSCNTCMYTMSCRGCEIPMDGVISISPRSSMTISYTNLSADIVAAVEPPDMAKSNTTWVEGIAKEEPLVDIYECLAAFSEIEHLDDHNPTWFCPRCKENRAATKALSICKVPDYLIVYLKRFVFMDQMSNKLNTRLQFPLTGLDLTTFIADEFRGSENPNERMNNNVFDLYACVCHFGSSTAGHYTAFGKNPETSQWNYFNDHSVTAKAPSEDEFTSAYVLFYARKGLKCDIPQRHMVPSSVYNPSQVCNMRFDSTSPSEQSGSKDACDSTSIIPDQEESSSVQNNSRTENRNSSQVSQVNSNEVVERSQIATDSDDCNEAGLDSTTNSALPSVQHLNSQQRLYQSNGDNSAPTSTTEAFIQGDHQDRLNCVREDVSNLHLCSSSSDQNSVAPLRRKVPSRASASPTIVTGVITDEIMEVDVNPTPLLEDEGGDWASTSDWNAHTSRNTSMLEERGLWNTNAWDNYDVTAGLTSTSVTAEDDEEVEVKVVDDEDDYQNNDLEKAACSSSTIIATFASAESEAASSLQ